jgi:hypothetical protein
MEIQTEIMNEIKGSLTSACGSYVMEEETRHKLTLLGQYGV